MKTPRDILLQRHRPVEPELDKIREKVVTTIGAARASNLPAVTTSRYPLRDFIYSLRWQLTGLSAAWLVIVFMRLNMGSSTTLASALSAAKIPSPQIILASLQANRRELLQLIQPAEAREVRSPKIFPRSERHDEILTT